MTRSTVLRRTAVVSMGLMVVSPALAAADVLEPRTGVRFAEREGALSLLGVGVRTKTFLSVKVYAIGLYVADTALHGPLAGYRGRTGDPAFFHTLVWGDFPKQVVMKFVRNTTADQVRDAFHESLPSVDPARLDTLAANFGAPRKGDVYVIRWGPGGVVETLAAGQSKPPIADKPFAAAVFAVWLGEKPIQEDIKRDLVARAEPLLRSSARPGVGPAFLGLSSLVEENVLDVSIQPVLDRRYFRGRRWRPDPTVLPESKGEPRCE